MANKRIDMSKLRYILILFLQGRSKVKIAEATHLSRNTIKSYLKTFNTLKISLDELKKLSDKELEELFVSPSPKVLNPKSEQLFEYFKATEKRMKKPGMNQLKLWEQYIAEYTDGYKKSQFSELYRRWLVQTKPVFHHEHKAGDKLYIDFTGDKLCYIDQSSGELIYVEVFISTLGASQLTYVQACKSQQAEELIRACENSFHYYGGIPAAVVPDNLKSAVTKSSKYEPTINKLFEEFSEHYGFTVLPARAYRPRDKAHVENMVKIVYSEIFTKLQERNFYSLEELNKSIAMHLEELNNKNFKGRDYSRRMQFEEIERKELHSLPTTTFEFKKYQFKTVAKNGHILLSEDQHSYSVPYEYIGKKVKIAYTQAVVEIYYNYERLAIHSRSKSKYHYTTDPEHLASTHKFYSEWNPERFKKWGYHIHEDVGRFVDKLFLTKTHPEQAYKSCLGVLSLEKKYSKERLIKACQRALIFGVINYKIVQNILERKLDCFEEEESNTLFIPDHDNIRGSMYYK
jgi:transposase